MTDKLQRRREVLKGDVIDETSDNDWRTRYLDEFAANEEWFCWARDMAETLRIPVLAASDDERDEKLRRDIRRHVVDLLHAVKHDEEP